jgi:hypothetical protein
VSRVTRVGRPSQITARTSGSVLLRARGTAHRRWWRMRGASRANTFRTSVGTALMPGGARVVPPSRHPPADQGRRPRSPRGRQPRAPNGAARKSTRVVSVPRRGRGPPSSPGRRQRRRPDLARGRAIGCWRRHAVAADELTQAIAEVAAYRDSARPGPHSARGSGSSPLTRVVAVFMPRSWAGRSEWLRGVRGRPMLDLDRGRLTGAWTE